MGQTEDNVPVSDVILPRWASSPEEFIRIHRMVRSNFDGVLNQVDWNSDPNSYSFFFSGAGIGDRVVPITPVDRSYLWLQTERYTGNVATTLSSFLES